MSNTTTLRVQIDMLRTLYVIPARVLWATAVMAATASYNTAAMATTGAIQPEDVILTAAGVSGLLGIWWKVWSDNRATDALRDFLKEDAGDWRALAEAARDELEQVRVELAEMRGKHPEEEP